MEVWKEGKVDRFASSSVLIGKADVSTQEQWLTSWRGWNGNEARGGWETTAETNDRSGFSSMRTKREKIRKAPISRRGVAVSVDGRNNGFIGARLKRHLLVCPFPSFFQTCSPFLLNF